MANRYRVSAKEHYKLGKKVGEGSSRSAYLIKGSEKTTVVKVAKSKVGTAQNKAEVLLFSKLGKRLSKRVAAIVRHCPKYHWIEMERLEDVSEVRSYAKWSKFQAAVAKMDYKFDYLNLEDIGTQDYPQNVGRKLDGTLALYDYGFSYEVSRYY